MSRSTTKMSARIAVVVIVMLTTLGAVAVGAAAVRAVTASSERAAIFNDAGVLPSDLTDAVTWRPDANRATRPMEPLTRELVTASWLRAWEQLRIVAETGDTSGVAVSFSNTALTDVLAGVGDHGGQTLQQQSHDLELTFYSDDGQVIGLTAHATELTHSVDHGGGDGRMERRSVEGYDAVLVLEDGSWRIHHLVRRSVELGPWIVVPE